MKYPLSLQGAQDSDESILFTKLRRSAERERRYFAKESRQGKLAKTILSLESAEAFKRYWISSVDVGPTISDAWALANSSSVSAELTDQKL